MRLSIMNADKIQLFGAISLMRNLMVLAGAASSSIKQACGSHHLCASANEPILMKEKCQMQYSLGEMG